jgi:hypothetical protein
VIFFILFPEHEFIGQTVLQVNRHLRGCALVASKVSTISNQAAMCFRVCCPCIILLEKSGVKPPQSKAPKGRWRNYRFLTPCFWASFGGEELPGFDAAKNSRFAQFFAIFNYPVSTPRFCLPSVSCFLNSVFYFRGVKTG